MKFLPWAFARQNFLSMHTCYSGEDRKTHQWWHYTSALLETYKGGSGYVYGVETITDSLFPLQIPDAATSREPTPVAYCKFIPDAYEAILVAEKAGLISIQRFAPNLVA